MAKDATPSSPEMQALSAVDRNELAGRLLVAVFAPKLDRPYPAVTGVELGEALAGLGAVRLPKYTWNTDRQPEAALARLALDLVLRWEAAGLAARGLSRDLGEVVLLEPGESALRADDPVAAARAALLSRA